MASPTTRTAHPELEPVAYTADGLPILGTTRTAAPEEPVSYTTDGLPILYEDEEEGDMGEANLHVITDEILHVCLKAHFADQPEYEVYSNMNCYYSEEHPHPKTGSLPYISPDDMVVKPFRPLPRNQTSYTIGVHGPAPLATAEVLSERSGQQRDLTTKVELYAKLGIAEYILVDLTGRYLPQKLVLKRLQPDGTYKDERDADGGVTSRLGFRLIIDTDGELRVIDVKTGRRYVRPEEAQAAADRAAAEAQARRKTEDRVRELEDLLKKASGGQPGGEPEP